MRCSFIFYGSLLEEEWRNKITKITPCSVLEGYIFGEIAVISESKPGGVCRYPILSVENQTLRIAAENVIYEGSDTDIEQITHRLKEYEGPLYQLVETNFYSEDEMIRTGLVFIENKLELSLEAVQAERITSALVIFDWRQYSA